jgi:hypothetical protein
VPRFLHRQSPSSSFPLILLVLCSSIGAVIAVKLELLCNEISALIQVVL